MGWLSKLPRWIRPPKSVRQEIEKISPANTIRDATNKILGGVSGAIQNIGGLVNEARGAAAATNKAAEDLAVMKTTLIVIALVVAGWFLFKKLR